MDSNDNCSKVFSEESINPYAHKIVLKIAKKLNGKESIGETSANLTTHLMNPNEQVTYYYLNLN